MYSASGAVRSGVVDQQIGDDAVTRHRRLVGRRRAGTAALDHADSGHIARADPIHLWTTVEQLGDVWTLCQGTGKVESDLAPLSQH